LETKQNNLHYENHSGYDFSIYYNNLYSSENDSLKKKKKQIKHTYACTHRNNHTLGHTSMSIMMMTIIIIIIMKY